LDEKISDIDFTVVTSQMVKFETKNILYKYYPRTSPTEIISYRALAKQVLVQFFYF